MTVFFLMPPPATAQTLGVTAPPAARVTVQQAQKKSQAGAKVLPLPPDEYIKAMQVLRLIAQKQGLAGLDKKASTIYRQWFERDEQRYFVWMSAVCDELTAYDFKTERQFALAEKYAHQALRKADAMPVGLEIGFVEYLERDVGYRRGAVRGAVWAKIRSEKATLWLHPLHRLEQEIDWDFDPNDPHNWPVMSLMPHAQGEFHLSEFIFGGEDPENIRDPQLRAAHRAANEANHRKALRMLEQTQLRQINECYAKRAERYLIIMYLRPPYNLPELKQKLDEFITYQPRKTRILAAVSQGMSRGKVKAHLGQRLIPRLLLYKNRSMPKLPCPNIELYQVVGNSNAH